MLAVSPRKNGSNGDRPQFLSDSFPSQNSYDMKSPLRNRYSREQLVDVFQTSQVPPPDNPLLQKFDIFTEQMLRPLMLSQSSAEEQMACLLLSNGTWTPSGAPASGPSNRGRGNDAQGQLHEGPNREFRAPGARGRGLGMAPRRGGFSHRQLGSFFFNNM